MARRQAGRWTHDHDGEGVVVFLVGMRVNHWWRPDRWLPAFLAMPRMLVELSRDPSRGFLGARTLLRSGGPTVVQYRRSSEDLHACASDAGAAHRPAWNAFHRRARDGRGAVGIWHGSICSDMPATGLAAAVGSRPVRRGRESAAERLAGSGTE